MRKPIIQRVGHHKTSLSRRVNFFDEGRPSGHMTEFAGTREADLELVIDVDKLINLLRDKAMKSNRRRSMIQFGSIILRVVKGTETNLSVPHVHTARCYKDGQPSCGNEGRPS